MQFEFHDKPSFMKKLKELLDSGLSPKKMKIVLPNPDHDVEHLVEQYTRPSRLKWFTLVGCATGCATGFLFTTFTAYHWPLITGGKPLLSIPAYTVIAFELTILFGALFSLLGLFVLARFPKFTKMFAPAEYGNEFRIIIEDEGA